MAVFKTLGGIEWTSNLVPGSFINEWNEIVRQSTMRNSSCTEMWTASVTCFCGGDFEQKMGSSLLEGRKDELKFLNTAFTINWVEKSVMYYNRNRLRIMFVGNIKAMKASAETPLDEPRSKTRHILFSWLVLIGSWNSVNTEVSSYGRGQFSRICCETCEIWMMLNVYACWSGRKTWDDEAF